MTTKKEAKKISAKSEASKGTVPKVNQPKPAIPAKKSVKPDAGNQAPKPKIEQPEIAQPETSKSENTKTPVKGKPESGQPVKKLEPVSEKLPADSKPETSKAVDTFASVRDAFFKEYMVGTRKVNASSISTYQKDFDRIVFFYCSDTPITEITPESVTAFANSTCCRNKDMTENSKVCAEPTIKKTLRLFKMFLEWLAETKRLETAPVPKDLPMGGKSAAEQENAKLERLARKAKAKEDAQKARAETKAKRKAEQEAGKVVSAPCPATAEPKAEITKPEVQLLTV